MTVGVYKQGHYEFDKDKQEFYIKETTDTNVSILSTVVHVYIVLLPVLNVLQTILSDGLLVVHLGDKNGSCLCFEVPTIKHTVSYSILSVKHTVSQLSILSVIVIQPG